MRNYIVIQDFMLTDLGLTGNDLLVYALVYGYSQDGESEYYGSLSHISELLRLDRSTVIRVLNRLVERGLVRKRDGEIRNVQRCFYSVAVADEVQMSEHGGDGETPHNSEGSGKMPPVAKCHRGSGKMPPPNINNKNIIKEKISLTRDSKEKAAEAANAPAPSSGNRKIFKKPSAAEVEAYCRARGNDVDAQHFVDYYEACGWRVGKNPMKDWQAAVRTWERNGINNNSNGTNDKRHNGSEQSRAERLAEARESIAASIEHCDEAYRSGGAPAPIHAQDLFSGV